MKLSENTYLYGSATKDKRYLVYLTITESKISNIMPEKIQKQVLVEYAEVAFKSENLVIVANYGKHFTKYALGLVTNNFSEALQAAQEDGVNEIIDLTDMSVIPAVEGDEE